MCEQTILLFLHYFIDTISLGLSIFLLRQNCSYSINMVMNEEDRKTLRLWQGLSEGDKLDAGITHEFYCTLCGIPFWLYESHHHGAPEDSGEGGFAWAGYFLARK